MDARNIFWAVTCWALVGMFLISIYEGRQFVCTYEIHWTGMLQIVLLVSLERSRGGGRGASAWFQGVWTWVVEEVLQYWMISSLKIKLNCSWTFRRNWNVPLVLLERSWWAGLSGIYLVRFFGFRMWEILILKWFLPLKIHMNSQKNQVLEGKISWERW